MENTFLKLKKAYIFCAHDTYMVQDICINIANILYICKVEDLPVEVNGWYKIYLKDDYERPIVARLSENQLAQIGGIE